MFFLYQCLSIVLFPLVYGYLLLRRAKGKEDATRFSERLGQSTLPRPHGTVIWIHAASVGESLSVLPLIDELIAQHPAFHVLVTSGTVTSAHILEKRLADKPQVIHQYTPVDTYISVRCFLRHWRPQLALWTESELWPCMLKQTKHYCPLILINARMSEKSFRSWRRVRFFALKLVGLFDLVLAQSEDYTKYFSTLGAKRALATGNLKFDAPPLPSFPKKLGHLLQMIHERPLWLAASTHEGEEEYVIKAHLQLKEKIPLLLTIIAPRHPDRGNSVVRLAQGAGLKAALRSEDQVIDSDTDIYVANTIGELGMFYRMASIAFVGGSFVKHGGQNPLEPARLNCTIVTGPYTYNFSDVYRELVANEGCIVLEQGHQLAACVERLFQDSKAQKHHNDRAVLVVKEYSGALKRVMQYLAPYLQNLAVTH